MKIRKRIEKHLFLSVFTKRRISKLIVKCFEGVDWNNNCFFCGNSQQFDKKGNKTFYSSKEIDNAMRKMNRVLRTLNK